MSPLKVAHLTTVDLSLEFLVLPQLLAARDAGAEVIGISAPGPHVPALEARGIRHVALPSSTRGIDPAADLRSIWELARVLRAERPDVLHTHNPKPGVYGRILGRLSGIPVVVNTVHGLYATPDDRLVKRVVVYGLETIATRFSDVELVQSEEDHRLLTRTHLMSPSKTRWLGNGVDLVRYDPGRFDDDERRAVRAAWGAGDDTVVVGMVGRLVAEKGYPELFEAAERLDDRYLVVCIGPDDQDKVDALDRDLIERAASSGVRFLGMRTDVDRCFAGMDLFVLPSHREGFPRAAMEAAAMGLPTVATDIRGCREVVGAGRTGFLVPVGDVDSLTDAIRRLGDDPDLARRMGAAATEKARSDFDERDVVQRVLAAYADGLAGVGKRWPVESGRAPVVRPARGFDVDRIAQLHLESISSGFLPRLGPRFLRLLYRALVEYPDATVLVADDGGVAGFVAGVGDTGAFYRHFVRRHGPVAAVAALPRALRPSMVRGVVETLAYGGPDERSEVRAELLSTAVDPHHRRRGIARSLGLGLFQEMERRGTAAMKVVVGAENVGAIAMYRSLGFCDPQPMSVHAESPSVEMVWRRSS